MAQIFTYMHLRIAMYAEVAASHKRISHIMCEYRGGLLRVELGKMTEQDIANELVFGQIKPEDNIIIRVRYGWGKPQFDRFMPGMDTPDTQFPSSIKP